MKSYDLIVVALSLSLIMTNAATNDDHQKTFKDYSFDLPDLSFRYEKTNLNAFKSFKNDKILSENSTARYAELRWISMGDPLLTQVQSNDNSKYCSLFHLTDEYFSFYFNMLTQRDRQELKDYVKQVKRIDVSTKAFVDLEPTSLECTFKLFNNFTQKSEVLKGTVLDFQSTPYELEFDYAIGTRERTLFEERIKRIIKHPLKIKCQASLGAQVKKTNTFKITVEQSNKMGLVDKLFGDANETLVTREQLSQLAQEFSSTVRVFEDYQMSDDQFSKAFVESLIDKASDGFSFMPFDDAWNGLSKYTLDIKDDLKPDIVKQTISKNFKVEKLGEKNHIIAENQHSTDNTHLCVSVCHLCAVFACVCVFVCLCCLLSVR